MDLSFIIEQVAQATVAAEPSEETASAGISLAPLGGGIAMGFAVMGAGIGIGRLAAAALEGAARQPEIMGRLQGMMILGIAFIEALALIAMVIGGFLL